MTDAPDAPDFRQALEDIAERRLPCLRCGLPHTLRPGNKHTAPSWAAPDGHAYERMSAPEYARQALTPPPPPPPPP